MSAMLSRLTTARFCARPWNRCVQYISLRICTFLNIKHRHGIPTHHSEAPNYLELQEGLKFPFPLHDAHPPFMHPSFLEFSRASESQNAVEDEQSFSLGKKVWFLTESRRMYIPPEGIRFGIPIDSSTPDYWFATEWAFPTCVQGKRLDLLSASYDLQDSSACFCCRVCQKVNSD